MMSSSRATLRGHRHGRLGGRRRPGLCRYDPQTYTPDPASAAACLTPRTRAIMLVHLAGRRIWMPSWPWPSVMILLSSKTRRRRGVPLGRAGGLGPWGTRQDIDDIVAAMAKIQNYSAELQE